MITFVFLIQYSLKIMIMIVCPWIMIWSSWCFLMSRHVSRWLSYMDWSTMMVKPAFWPATTKAIWTRFPNLTVTSWARDIFFSLMSTWFATRQGATAERLSCRTLGLSVMLWQAAHLLHEPLKAFRLGNMQEFVDGNLQNVGQLPGLLCPELVLWRLSHCFYYMKMASYNQLGWTWEL